MKEVKSINISLPANMKLSTTETPKIESEIKEMRNIPY